MMTRRRQAQELQDAVRCGDVVLAQQLVSVLAEERANVVIRIEDWASESITTSSGSQSPNGSIRLKVNFEDSSTNDLISAVVNINPNVTFCELKSLLHQNYGFDPMLQRCIVGRLCPQDGDVLSSCGLDDDCSELFVYVLSKGAVSEPSVHPMSCDLTRVNINTSVATVTTATSSAASSTVTRASAKNFFMSDQPSPNEMWSCRQCTYQNHHSMHVCEMCDLPREGCRTDARQRFNDYEDAIDVDADGETDLTGGFDTLDGLNGLPDVIIMDDDRLPSASWTSSTSQKRKSLSSDHFNYDALMAAEFESLIENSEPFECPICFSDIDTRCGVVLRDCLHMFCRKCLADHIGYADTAAVTCPFDNGTYQCQSTLQDREIRALVTDDVYEKHLQLSSREAEGKAANSYHCATPDCSGWCTFEDDVNDFFCYVCHHVNCLTCRAVHDTQNCIDYQAELRAKKYSDPAAMIADSTLEELLKFGDAMKCPGCQVVIIKKDGCDWIMCTVCKLEICWVTKQARWGPKGRGDTSGGCRCRANKNKLCDPRCQNCH